MKDMYDGVMKVMEFQVKQVKFNKFLHTSEHPQSIFLYLVRPFDSAEGCQK